MPVTKGEISPAGDRVVRAGRIRREGGSGTTCAPSGTSSAAHLANELPQTQKPSRALQRSDLLPARDGERELSRIGHVTRTSHAQRAVEKASRSPKRHRETCPARFVHHRAIGGVSMVEGTSGAADGSGFREHGSWAALRPVGSVSFGARARQAGRPRPSHQAAVKAGAGRGRAKLLERGVEPPIGRRAELIPSSVRCGEATAGVWALSGWGKSVPALSGVGAGVATDSSGTTPRLKRSG
jgi:hypothetical protein